MKKKIIGIFMVLCMMSGLMSFMTLPALAATSGTCGDNLTWVLDDEGTLTISGDGSMMNYTSSSSAPWYSSRSSITNVVINSGVTTIGDYAFYNCSKLTSITIPDSVTSIGNYGFGVCSNLTNITIPNSVTSIGEYAFYSCKKLTRVMIGNGVTSIGRCAFIYCSNLTNITIPNSVTSIGTSAFSGCPGLTTVIIPESVKTIYTDSFAGNTIWLVYENSKAHTFAMKNNLLYFVISENATPEIYITGGVTYFIQNSEAIAISCDKSTTTVSIPSMIDGYPVTELRYTFYNCDKLKSATLPESLKMIDDYTFYGCSSLANITIPNSVTRINRCSFADCSSLESITIPSSVTNIGTQAFAWCYSLKSIAIPDSITSIGSSAFGDCRNLTDVYYKGTESEWESIYIYSGNDTLTNATIHYVEHTRTTISEDGKTFSVNPLNIETGASIILALYDNGKFVEAQVATYEGEEITFTTTKSYTNANVMVWNDFTTLNPTCGIEAVK